MTGGEHSVLLWPVTSSPSGRRVSQWLMALLLLSAGTAHFVRPGTFVQIVPPLVPWPWAAVYLSGGSELVLGIGLLIPRLSRLAASGIVLLLAAVFPANVYHWLGNVHVDGTVAPGWYHVVRLPMQALLIGWAFWLSRPTEEAPKPGASA